MALTKLSAQQLSFGAPTAPVSEYAQFLAGLDVGEGGRTTVEAEGVSRQTIKARLAVAAGEVGAGIKFHRAPKNEVIFEVTGAATMTPVRRRRRRSASATTEQTEG